VIPHSNLISTAKEQDWYSYSLTELKMGFSSSVLH